jgi:zinc D-Ala-D-Ala carboxypeptidase
MTWENFKREEFMCQCGCRGNEIADEFIDVLQAIRSDSGVPMPISSGYRCEHHPIEARKDSPGTHTTGFASDVLVSRGAALKIIKAATAHPKVTGLGINQKGNSRFIHIDIVTDNPRFARPNIWSY